MDQKSLHMARARLRMDQKSLRMARERLSMDQKSLRMAHRQLSMAQGLPRIGGSPSLAPIWKNWMRPRWRQGCRTTPASICLRAGRVMAQLEDGCHMPRAQGSSHQLARPRDAGRSNTVHGLYRPPTEASATILFRSLLVVAMNVILQPEWLRRAFKCRISLSADFPGARHEGFFEVVGDSRGLGRNSCSIGTARSGEPSRLRHSESASERRCIHESVDACGLRNSRRPSWVQRWRESETIG